MKNRTSVDFSKHILKTIKHDEILIHEFKIPNTIRNSVTFINACGVMTVTGDFGNWVFCREFHPSHDGFVSGGYWDEKLEIASQQKAHKFDSDETLKKIEEFKEEFINLYDREMNEEERDWVESLENSVFDEYEYTYVAYREKPAGIDYDEVPFGLKRHSWLDAVYDAFDAVCKLTKDE